MNRKLTIITFSCLFLLSWSGLFSQIPYTQALSQAEIDDLVATVPQPINTDIEEKWANIAYEMLLIVPDNQEFIDAANVLAEWKTQIGIPALVVSNYSLYPGVDNPEKIRNLIIALRQIYPIQWVLLMGDTDIIPIRYIYNPDSVIIPVSEAQGSDTLKPTDYYYAELSSDWDIDNDGIWGEDAEYNTYSSSSEIDFNPEVYVGRFPADNAEELGKMVNKTIFYEQATNAGVWMKNYLAVSGISDMPGPSDVDGEYEAVLNQYIIDNYLGNSMNWTHIYEYTPGYYPAPVAPQQHVLTSTNMRENITNGCSIAIWAGHGAPNSFAAQTVSSALNVPELPLLGNTNMFSLLIADACSTNAYDFDNSIGEQFFKLYTTGGIGYIGAMRISWYYSNDTQLQQLNRGITKQLLYEMFENGYYQQGKALYESKRSYANGPWMQSLGTDFQFIETERKIITTYMLLGDPSVDIFTNEPKMFKPLVFEATPAYEGNRKEIQILNIDDEPVPNAIITITSDDGKYNVFKADDNGTVIISLPAGIRTYNYTLTGHNMVFRNNTFSTIADTVNPIFLCPPMLTAYITEDDHFNMIFDADDAESGISDVLIIYSTDNFTNYQYIIPERVDTTFSGTFPLLDSATYNFSIVIFDGVGNYNTEFGTFFIEESPPDEKPTTIDPVADDDDDDNDNDEEKKDNDPFKIDGFFGFLPICLVGGLLYYRYRNLKQYNRMK